MSHASVCCIELGRSDPPVSTVEKLADALGVSPDNLMRRSS